jgi:hypothetical protein
MKKNQTQKKKNKLKNQIIKQYKRIKMIKIWFKINLQLNSYFKTLFSLKKKLMLMIKNSLKFKIKRF